ncbi:hypothetical protein EHR03_12950 [Leptospira mayottensis]|uniref:Uncharacterized protein n=1 Tax=Leptospira mayottensis 200901116 TaxID=1192864 RepID=M6V6J0_9LEPT|nr:hypothetical protein [Leptospira mayottensis]AVH81605.1 hypothetical protein [Leptospira mayottensis 200901116]TGN00332.1 hypothetical protein EHR03_12950 [Leptospira mayottensis]
MRAVLFVLFLSFSIALFGQDTEDLNRCVAHEWMGNQPAFFDFVSSASIEEIKSKKQDIQFNKLASHGRSVLIDIAQIRVFKDGLLLFKFLIENGALISTEDEDLGSPVSKKNEICTLVPYKEKAIFEYLLSVEPHLSRVSCRYYNERTGTESVIPITDYVKNTYNNYKNDKLKLLKAAFKKSETVPLTYTAADRMSAPECY